MAHHHHHHHHTQPEGPPRPAAFEPTSPSFYAAVPVGDPRAGQRQTIPLLCKHLHVSVECHVAMAFVTVETTWMLPPNIPGADCIFAMPMHSEGTVTEVTIDRGGKDVFTTAIVPLQDTTKYKGGSKGGGADDGEVSKPASYNAAMFKLAVPKVVAGQELRTTALFFQPLDFSGGWYHLRLPMVLPPGSGVELNPPPPCSATILINTGTPAKVQLGNLSHKFQTAKEGPGHVNLASDRGPGGRWKNHDITVSYCVWGDGIVASMNVQTQTAAVNPADPRASFCLAVSPPAPGKLPNWPRSVVFLVDRSGSMTGDPMASANQAIHSGLDLLNEHDQFNIIAFDHEQTAFDPGLMQATPEAKAKAHQWIASACQARGLTDIATPLMMAQGILANAGGVPYIFLITDGAVDNERAICQSVQVAMDAARQRGAQDVARMPRIWTFGIGQFCNHFFLKQLAALGRGMSDAAFVPSRILNQIERMLDAAAKPVLTDVALKMEGLPPGVEVYPFPIPDLFCGRPLIISGKYNGSMPRAIGLHGALPGGQVWKQDVPVTSAASIPLDKVFIKQRLDLLTAQAWLTNDPMMTARVVDLSVATGVPCAHTAMVGFNVKRDNLQAVQTQRRAGNLKVAAMAVGGVAGIAVIGAVAFGFGDVASTLGNLSGDIGAGAMDALAGMGGFFESTGDGCADCFEGAGEGMVECCESAGDVLCDICNSL